MRKKGFQYLIEYCNSDPQELNMPQVIEAIRYGSTTQPSLFQHFVKAYMELVLRTDAGRSPADHGRSVTLDNIAVLCVLADHDWAQEIIPQARQGGPQQLEEYLDNEKLYGPAVKLLARYVGVEGVALRRFVCDEQYRN